MKEEERKAWDILIKNRMNPAHWQFQGSSLVPPHAGRDPVARLLVTFKNILTRDVVLIDHAEPTAKKKSWRIFREKKGH